MVDISLHSVAVDFSTKNSKI